MLLVCAFASHDRNRSEPNDFGIGSESKFLKIFEVKLDHFGKGQIASAHHLPVACHSLGNVHALPLFVGKFVALVDRQRSGAHETHVTQKYVDELRQFVQAKAAHKSTDWRDSRIVLHFEDCSILFVTGFLKLSLASVGIHIHASELEKMIDFAVLAIPIALVYDWSG